MELIILIGMQASGKSTFCRENFFDTHIRINLDMLRTRRREQIIFEACLATKQAVVIDNTNPTAADRARYIPAARDQGYRVIGYYFESEFEECSRRNLAREKVIPLAGLYGTHGRLECPTLKEGFDELYNVRIDPDGGFVVRRMRRQRVKRS